MATACPRLMPTIAPCTPHDVRGSEVSLTLRRGTRAEACTKGVSGSCIRQPLAVHGCRGPQLLAGGQVVKFRFEVTTSPDGAGTSKASRAGRDPAAKFAR